MAVCGIGTRFHRAGLAMATALALLVVSAGCTEAERPWIPTAPEPVGSLSYASQVQEVSCAGATCVTVGTSSAAVWAGERWSETVVPAGATFGFVTCATPGLCLANPSRTSDGLEAPLSRLDGTRWVPAADPTSALTGARVTEVACAGGSFCVAAATRAGVGELLHWDGTAWSPTPTPSPLAGTVVVDCAAPDACLTMTAAGPAAAAYAWDGQAWSVAAAPPVSVVALSCGAPAACLATGYEIPSGIPRLVAWDGTAWAFAPAPPEPVYALDCGSVTSCLALTAPPLSTPYVLDGAAWRPVPLPATIPAVTPTTVSCVAPGRCLAAGSRRDGAALHRAALWWDGSAWTGEPDLGRPTRPRGRFQAVSCPVEIWCMAVGTGMNGTSVVPNIQLKRGLRWEPIAVAGVVPDPDLDVSCSSPLFCMIVGASSAPGAGRDRVLQWNGRELTAVDIRPVLGTGRGPSRVSCPTSTFCLASGGGVTIRYDGTTWASVANPSGNLRDLDCANAQTCRATMLTIGPTGPIGVIASWDGAAWVQSPLPPVEIAPVVGEQLSCFDATHCIATGRASRTLDPLVLTYNGLGWTPTPVTADRREPSAAVGCTDARRCVVVTATGGASPPQAFVAGDVTTGPWMPIAEPPHSDGMTVVPTNMACRRSRCMVVGFETGGGAEVPYGAILQLGDPETPDPKP
jgi:hypothetical protein